VNRAAANGLHEPDASPTINRVVRLLRTSVGRKLLVGVAGLALGVFVVVHLLGNLLVFKGQKAMNEYSFWLNSHPAIWILRAGLLAALVAHVQMGTMLTLRNRAARPQRYRIQSTVQADPATRHMMLTGVLIFTFIVYHLLHLTFGVVPPNVHGAVDPDGLADVYTSVVLSFHNPWVAGAYVLAIGALGLHLSHASLSVLQTIGFHHESYERVTTLAARAIVLLLVLGFWSIPISILLGWVG